MTAVVGLETGTPPHIPELPEDPKRSADTLRSLGRFAAGIVSRATLPLAGTLVGAYVALNGAHYETTIDGTHVEATTTIDTEDPGLHTAIELSDGRHGSMSLGGVDFPEFADWLPVSMQATAHTGATEVERTITERYRYFNQIKTDAEEARHDAEAFFVRRLATDAGIGLGGGLIANELVAAGWRRYRSKDSASALPSSHSLLRSLGHNGLAVSLLATGGVLAASTVHPNLSYYEGYGVIGQALKSPDGFSHIRLQSPILDNILRDFQEAHACPETPLAFEHPDDSLTVTTYNIKRGQYNATGIKEVARELARTKSDVILLEEVTPAALDELAAELDMQAYPGWTIENEDLTYGNAILTNLTVEYSEYVPLPSEDVEQRGALVLELASPDNGKPFIVAATHLTNEHLTVDGDSNAAIRQRQAEALIERLEHIRQGDEAVIVGGDFNERVHGPAYDMLTGDFDDTVAEELEDSATFPENGLRFDNILISSDSDWDTLDATRGGANHSDHCLVSVDLGMAEQYVTPADTAIIADASATAESGRKRR